MRIVDPWRKVNKPVKVHSYCTEVTILVEFGIPERCSPGRQNFGRDLERKRRNFLAGGNSNDGIPVIDDTSLRKFIIVLALSEKWSISSRRAPALVFAHLLA